MANLRNIFLAVKSYLEDANIDGVTQSSIHSANTPVKNKTSGMFLEINCVPLRMGENKMERVTVTPVMVNIYVCVPVASGEAYAEHISASVARRFSEQSPDKWAFKMPDGVFYVRGLDRVSGFVENSWYRCTVQVLVDVYETR